MKLNIIFGTPKKWQQVYSCGHFFVEHFVEISSVNSNLCVTKFYWGETGWTRKKSGHNSEFSVIYFSRLIEFRCRFGQTELITRCKVETCFDTFLTTACILSIHANYWRTVWRWWGCFLILMFGNIQSVLDQAILFSYNFLVQEPIFNLMSIMSLMLSPT